jgi:hypothetical protein
VANGPGCLCVRVRVEIMGSQKCGFVGKSQPVLMMINPIIFTRTRTERVFETRPQASAHESARVLVLRSGGAADF